MRTPICDELGIDVPIFAFTRSPEVAAAVSRAGGLGVLGAVEKSLEQLREAIDFVEEHAGGRPFGVDVVMPVKYVGSDAGGFDAAALEGMIPQAHRAFLEDMLQRYQVPPLPQGKHAWHSLLAWTEATTRPQVELALSRKIALIANALGPPPRDIVEQAHARGIRVAALASRARHALKSRENGVDVIVAQGTEAGGHCGEIATLVLVPEVVDAVHPAPVLAAGGIGCGRQIAAALALGAQGAWTGSLWLTAAESDVAAPIREKLLRASSSDTVRSRALSGKPARQLKSAWQAEWDDPKNPDPLPMPLHFMLMAEATTRIHHFAGQPGTRAAELATSPVGQIVGRMNQVRPVAEIMDALVKETRETLRRLAALGALPAPARAVAVPRAAQAPGEPEAG
jgi:NAD(P)H-dependent flavin oxidoreductase YrpB (nitropropane dioxygenase family)